MQQKVVPKFLAVAFLLVGVFLSPGCFYLICDEEEILELTSPDSKRVVTVYVRNCGATTDYATRAEVRWQSSFRDDQDRVFSVDGRRNLLINWLDGENLSISCHECTEDQVHVRVTKLGRVAIRYDDPEIDKR